MKNEYSQRSNEDHRVWLQRLYAEAYKVAEEKGWLGVDPDLLSILLNNMGGLLRDTP